MKQSESFNRVPTANIEVGKQSQIHFYSCQQLIHKAYEYLKVGYLVRSVRFFILDTDLPYALLGLKSCIEFQLVTDCVKQVVAQKGINLINFSSSEGSDLSLHIDPENSVKEDASLTGLGAVLKQPDSSVDLHPVSFHSRSLKDYENNYGFTELECLAIVNSLNKFHHYLFGQKFTIHKVHAALVWLKNLKERLFRWYLQLSMYEYKFKYTKGTTDFEADMLSRDITEKNTESEGGVTKLDNHVSHLLQLEEIKEAQKRDNLIGNFIEINTVLCIPDRLDEYDSIRSTARNSLGTGPKGKIDEKFRPRIPPPERKFKNKPFPSPQRTPKWTPRHRNEDLYKSKSKLTCFNCGKEGHASRFCMRNLQTRNIPVTAQSYLIQKSTTIKEDKSEVLTAKISIPVSKPVDIYEDLVPPLSRSTEPVRVLENPINHGIWGIAYLWGLPLLIFPI
ncbi:retrotransposable element Tf2 protein type 1 [Nephila pilipes]|uniref:Retrotransposable element Tf2 protein type 1 n=1 Tax=Nephila pilipes TaxID=299642 RepID=A0A8X6PXA1_NEPPI|nr:retrotransposable element Tf2 protein type 1 [Nephila pilipes]